MPAPRPLDPTGGLLPALRARGVPTPDIDLGMNPASGQAVMLRLFLRGLLERDVRQQQARELGDPGQALMEQFETKSLEEAVSQFFAIREIENAVRGFEIGRGTF